MGFMFIEYIFTINIAMILVFFLWVDAVKCIASATFPDLFEVIDFSTCYTCLSISWASSGWMNGTTVLTSLSYRCSGLFLQLHLCNVLSHLV